MDASDGELLGIVIALDFLVFSLFATYCGRSPSPHPRDDLVNDPSRSEPNDDSECETSQKISNGEERHRQIHNNYYNACYKISHNFLCWAWLHRPDAHQALSLLTAVLVIIGIIALKDSEDTLELSQRAWVGPTDAHLDNVPAIDDKGIAAADVKVSVSMQNTGRQPAKDVNWFVRAIIVTDQEMRDPATTKNLADFVSNCFLYPTIAHSRVAYPTIGLGEGYTLHTKIDKYLIDWDVIYGINYFLIQGCAAYETLNKRRHSAFCYFYQQGRSDIAHLNICAGGADAN
jgi:hypothetical protein